MLTLLLQVFLGRLDKLADHMVKPSTGAPWKADANGNIDKAACIAELKRRLQPVPASIERPKGTENRGTTAKDRNSVTDCHRG